MRASCIILFSILCLSNGAEIKRGLLETIKQLHLTSFLTNLNTEQQLLLVDIVAHGDEGTLTNFIPSVGYDRILQILHDVSSSDETEIKQYLLKRLNLEAQGPINVHHGVATGTAFGK